MLIKPIINPTSDRYIKAIKKIEQRKWLGQEKRFFIQECFVRKVENDGIIDEDISTVREFEIDQDLFMTIHYLLCNKKREIEIPIRTPISAGLRWDILDRDDRKCVVCGREEKDKVKLHIDHIVPVSKGGQSVPENLQTLCQDCNLGKGNKLEEE